MSEDRIVNGPHDNSFKGLGYKTLAQMATSPASVRMEIQAAGHPELVPVMSEEQATVARQNIAAATGTKVGKPATVDTIFARGKIVLHKPTGHKVTVIRAYAGRSQGGEKMHEVVDNKRGNKFLAKESNLKPVRD